MIRIMVARNIEAVHKIEMDSFKFPWSENQFTEEFVKPYSKQYVLENENSIIGYFVGWYIEGELEIGTIAISKEARRNQYASKLLTFVFKELSKIKSCFLEVNSENRNAQNLYISLGFKEINRRKEYYKDGADALILKKSF